MVVQVPMGMGLAGEWDDSLCPMGLAADGVGGRMG